MSYNIRTILFVIIFLTIMPTFSLEIEDQIAKNRPSDFVNIKQIIPEIQVDMRYYSNYNFMGKQVTGYIQPICLLTKSAASALKTVEQKLLSMGLTLKVYDCYRPQRAVNDFISWAKQLSNLKMRTEFYPDIEKRNLFKDGYIAAKSAHSRGSTVDITLTPAGSVIPNYSNIKKLRNCNLPKAQRNLDNSLDFGTGFDCFSLRSHPSYAHLSPQVKANRLLLETLMVQVGFKPLAEEWWHFTLDNEPYPNIYFDFPIEDSK